MGDAREMLAMLTPHGVRYGYVRGGVPIFTPQDIAAAVGIELTEEEGSYMLAKYAEDGQQYREARVFWFERVMEETRAKGWKSAEPYRFKNMADATLDEFMSTGNCKECQGVGHQMTETGRVEACPVCQGTAKKWPSERSIAQKMDISVMAYRETWTPRVSWCRRWLTRMEIDCKERLDRRLCTRYSLASLTEQV